MDVVLCAYCVVQKGERRGEGGRWWSGKVPRSPAAPSKEKKRGEGKKQLADRKVPERPRVVKGEGYKTNKKCPWYLHNVQYFVLLVVLHPGNNYY
jgi:hypothetical protein